MIEGKRGGAVLALDALEHARLAQAGCAASIDLLVEGQRPPGLDFEISWATLVPIGGGGSLQIGATPG